MKYLTVILFFLITSTVPAKENPQMGQTADPAGNDSGPCCNDGKCPISILPPCYANDLSDRGIKVSDPSNTGKSPKKNKGLSQ